jgi:hypothetical protein
MTSDPASEDFIARWRGSSASERANAQMFLSELSELLGEGKVEVARGPQDRYAFEFPSPTPTSPPAPACATSASGSTPTARSGRRRIPA